MAMTEYDDADLCDLDYVQVRMRFGSWRHDAAPMIESWHLALDIGQAVDPSAVCALQHKITPLDMWQANPKTRVVKQDRRERFLVRHLERLPLQTPYPQQVQHVANLLARPPVNDSCTFTLDYTGVGRPVADMFTRAGLRPQCVLITAGNEATHVGGDTWHVPKQMLVSAVEARLHSGELKIAAELAEAGALADELKDFARKVSDAGRISFSARTGKHDDLVLAVCLAVFAATNRTTTIVEPFPFI